MTQRIETPDIMGAVLAGNDQPLATTLRIADIRRDGGTQPRAGLDETHVSDLVAALAAGETLPPVDVMYDGAAYWLYDGYHRVEATSRAGKYTVQAIIHQGDQVAAQWASYAANSRHGLKRTNEDKRRAVLAALRHPNAAEMSNRALAAHVGVDESMVRDHRAKLEATAGIPQSTTRTGADGRTINTANIGASQPQYAAVWQLETVVKTACSSFYDADDQRHACSDMRAAARVREGGFWARCMALMPEGITEYRKADLAQAINNVASQMEASANGTNAQASTGGRSDIASREAAAAEAERQAQADMATVNHQAAPVEPAPVAEVLDADLFAAAEKASITALKPGQMREWFWCRGAHWISVGGIYAARNDVNGVDERHCVRVHPVGAEIEPGVRIGRYMPDAYLPGTMLRQGALEWRIGAQWLIVKRQRQDAQATANQPAATALADLPVVATTDTRQRYRVAATCLHSAVRALAVAADAIRDQDADMRNRIEMVIGSLRQVAASAVERGEPQPEPPPPAPEPQPPAAPTELPPALVAHGWTLTTMRGKHYASVTVPNEPEPIRTIGRGDVAATIRDAEYMHRNLRIGVTA